MKIRFGIGLGADTGPEQLANIVDHLEATGVDSLWFSELVYSKAVDPFVGMAYALARTSNLKVGTSVAVLPGRHPVLVAKQLASLAGLAPKRVLPVFGLRSAIPAEREIFVVPDGERAAVFDESLHLLRSVLEQQDVAFAGANDWPQLHRQLDAYLAAGLTKFVIRPAHQANIDDFIDRFVAELVPRQN